LEIHLIEVLLGLEKLRKCKSESAVKNLKKREVKSGSAIKIKREIKRLG
jgi:hypothetical protein